MWHVRAQEFIHEDLCFRSKLDPGLFDADMIGIRARRPTATISFSTRNVRVSAPVPMLTTTSVPSGRTERGVALLITLIPSLSKTSPIALQTSGS
jgi:hypothetical protein